MMKKLLLLSFFALGTAIASNAQTPLPKTADAKAKSCCAAKAEKAQCAEMKAAAHADAVKSAAPAVGKAAAETTAPKKSCCASKAAGEVADCKGKKTASAKKD